jgi:vitamin B12 transporter
MEVWMNRFRGGRSRSAALFLGGVSLTATLMAQTVVVTGSREPMALDRLAADVVLIDGDTLRQTRADSLADLLRREAGLQISRSGGPGQSTGLLMRGTASQQSVVMVDGVRVGSATLGYAAVETLGLSALERVEVLRGPGSSLYGADAVGGVVNLITRRPVNGLQADARLAAGGYGARELSAGLRGSQGVLDYSLSLASEQAEGVSALKPGDAFGNYNPDRDGFKLDTAQVRVGLQATPDQRVGVTLLRTKLNSQYDASEYLPPSFAQDASADFRTRVTTTVAALDWRATLSRELTASARAVRSEDDAANGGTEIDRFRTRRQQVGAQLAWQTGVIGQLVLALEHGRDEASSTSYTADVQRRTTAGALELTGTAQAWSWQADVRRDDSSDFGAVNTARLGGGLELMPGLRLRALAGTTFRAPSFNDLYYPGYGVPSLAPEHGRSLEAGLQWRGDRNEAAATLWRNRVRDLVAYESNPANCPADPSYSFGCAANINRAQLQGLTLSGRQRLGAWAWRAQVDFLRARDGNTGERLPRRAAQQATLGVDWTVGPWRAGASLLHLGKRPDGGGTLAAETTLDISASWQFMPAWTLQAKLQNATDEATEPVRDYQGQGRQAWIVLRYEPKL